MDNPKISVVMPVYNSAKSLKRAIESILDQTFRDFEFIIVNEFGSDDGSREIIEQYAASDARVRLIQLKKREGIGESLNIGIRAARGVYIARMDADDYSYPNRFEIQYDYMEKHPGCVLCGSAVRIINPLNVSGIGGLLKSDPDSDSIKANLLFSCVIWHPTVFFRRNEFVTNNWFYSKISYAEDFELWTRVTGEMGNLPITLLDYTVDGSNASLRDSEKMRDAFIAVSKRQFLDKLNVDAEKYDDSLLWAKEENYTIERGIHFLQNGYAFLREIETQNIRLNEFAIHALTTALCNKWNHYAYITMSKIGIPKEVFSIMPSDTTTKLFEEILGQTLCVPTQEIPQKIEKMIYSYIDKYKFASRVIVFGCGLACSKYFAKFPGEIKKVVCFCDNNYIPNEGFLGKRVIRPSDILEQHFDIIAIATNRYFEEISNQLITEYGIDREKIVGISLLRCLKQERNTL